jgi:hypothetical protein
MPHGSSSAMEESILASKWHCPIGHCPDRRQLEKGDLEGDYRTRANSSYFQARIRSTSKRGHGGRGIPIIHCYMNNSEGEREYVGCQICNDVRGLST